MRRVATLTACLALCAAGHAAQAGTVTIQNTTDNVSYSSDPNGGPYNFYNNGTSAVGPGAVGDTFTTSQLAFTTTQLTNGSYTLDLQYTTLFSGSETVGNATVYYPDIFLRNAPGGYSNAGFNYAISLGDEAANGGLAAGLYATTSYLNSQQVWSSRPGFGYAGQYTNTTAYQPGQAGYTGYLAPTVLTGGTKVANVSVTNAQQAGGAYVVDVSLTLTAAQAAIFASGADVFWGTGDCANGSFLATLSAMGTPPALVPEPATLALLAAGLLTIVQLRRRQTH